MQMSSEADQAAMMVAKGAKETGLAVDALYKKMLAANISGDLARAAIAFFLYRVSAGLIGAGACCQHDWERKLSRFAAFQHRDLKAMSESAQEYERVCAALDKTPRTRCGE